MASTSSTNAAIESRTTSDDRHGTFFFGGDGTRTLVEFEPLAVASPTVMTEPGTPALTVIGTTAQTATGRNALPSAATTGSRRARVPAHASGCP